MKLYYTKQLNLPSFEEYFESLPEDRYHSATVVGDDMKLKVVKSIRSAKHVSLPDENWIAQYCLHHATVINREAFNFKLDDRLDEGRMSYIVYEKDDHYIWHHDVTSSTPPRKLSFSLLLNDDYEGGELQFATWHFGQYGTKMSPLVKTVKTPAGTMVVFPSHHPHRVTPVTKGVRKCLVGCVVGSPLQ